MTTELPRTRRDALLALADKLGNGLYAGIARQEAELYPAIQPAYFENGYCDTGPSARVDAWGDKLTSRLDRITEDIQRILLTLTDISGIFADVAGENPPVDPTRAAALTAATQLLRGDRDVTDTFVIEMARTFEAYLRGDPDGHAAFEAAPTPTRQRLECALCGRTNDHTHSTGAFDGFALREDRT